MEPFTTYSSAVQGVLGPGWWSQWPLSTRHEVGDVCLVENGQLLAVSTLAALGAGINASDSPYRDELTYDQNGSVAVTFKAAGATGPLFNAVASADAGAHLGFSREQAVFAAFAGLRELAVDDPRSLARPLARLYLNGEWEPEWVAVTHVLKAAAGTVLIAAQAGAEVELRLQATVGAPMLTVADVAGQSGFTRRSGLGFEWTADDGCTPFVRVVRVRKTWLRDIDVDYTPRQKVKGLAPPEVPTRVLQAAEREPDSVVEVIEMPVPGISAPAGPSEQ